MPKVALDGSVLICMKCEQTNGDNHEDDVHKHRLTTVFLDFGSYLSTYVRYQDSFLLGIRSHRIYTNQ